MATIAQQKSRFIPEPVSIWLGQGDQITEYKVVPAGWSSLTRLKTVFRNLMDEVAELWSTELVTPSASPDPSAPQPQNTIKQLVVNERLWDMYDSLLRKPHEVLELAIPGLDPNLFSPDNPKGITTVQVIAAFETIAEVNRLEVAKKLMGGLMTTANSR